MADMDRSIELDNIKLSGYKYQYVFDKNDQDRVEAVLAESDVEYRIVSGVALFRTVPDFFAFVAWYGSGGAK